MKKRKREKDFLNRSNEAKSVIWQWPSISTSSIHAPHWEQAGDTYRTRGHSVAINIAGAI